jgi:predicted site-specific integrase-resolvase
MTEKKQVRMLSLKEVAEKTGAAASSIRLWVRQGRFPNAQIEETRLGKLWLVPETDLKYLKLKPAGRPQGSKNKNPRKKK